MRCCFSSSVWGWSTIAATLASALRSPAEGACAAGALGAGEATAEPLGGGLLPLDEALLPAGDGLLLPDEAP